MSKILKEVGAPPIVIGEVVMSDLDRVSGVDYGKLDAFKRLALAAGTETEKRFVQRQGRSHNLLPMAVSRGGSAYLIRTPAYYLAHVEEGLGTKHLVAQEMMRITGSSDGYLCVGSDGVAMIVNDMITTGAMPLSVAMHLALGSNWFARGMCDWGNHPHKLIAGWQHACEAVDAVWSGGETAELRDVLPPDGMVLSGSAIGQTLGPSWFNPKRLRDGDVIIFCTSSGIHANGITRVREIARTLPYGYLTPVSEQRNFGDTVLTPAHIYVPFVAQCLREGVDIRYAVHITGHGWRKLMRAPQPFTYLIHSLPPEQPIFSFIADQAKLTSEEMYASYNMGVGFALFVSPADRERVFSLVQREPPRGFDVFTAGYVKNGPKQVVIEPLGITYAHDSLNIR